LTGIALGLFSFYLDAINRCQALLGFFFKKDIYNEKLKHGVNVDTNQEIFLYFTFGKKILPLNQL